MDQTPTVSKRNWRDWTIGEGGSQLGLKCEEVSLSVKGGRVTSLLKLVLKQHQQPSTPTPVPQTQHGKLYTGREERCVQAPRDRNQVRVTTGEGRGGTRPPPN